MLYSTKSLISYTVKSTDANVGELWDFLFNDNHRTIQWFVVELYNKAVDQPVVVVPTVFSSLDSKTHTLLVSFTEDDLKKGPDIDVNHPTYHLWKTSLPHNWPLYWGGGGLLVAGLVNVRSRIKKKNSLRDRNYQVSQNLLSIRDVIGYCVQAKDGRIGYVEDFIIDCGNWTIRHVVVNTQNWFTAKKVLVPIQQINQLCQKKHKLYTNFSREVIRNYPEFSPSEFFDNRNSPKQV